MGAGSGVVPERRLGVDVETFAVPRIPALLRTAIALCGGRASAEDLVQDVLLKAFRNWDRVRGADEPDAYLRRMLVNEFISSQRSWVRQIPVEQVPTAGHAPDPADRQADQDQIGRLLRRLPRRQRAVLALRYFAALHDAEIAAILNCSEGTVRGHAARAMATPRHAVQDEPDPSDGRLNR